MLNVDEIKVNGRDPAVLFAGIANCDAVGVAVSGGPDSLALMLLVSAWFNSLGQNRPRILVYCVDHGLRPEAADEARMVVGLAGHLGFSARVLTWTGEKPETGIQAAARDARYALIANAMAEDGADTIVTAHHKEDQAETVLMRMAHGSGLSGLGGMHEWVERDGITFFRPLLDVPRADLHQIVKDAGWAPAHDPSNLDVKYERTRWRNALPQLDELGLGTDDLGRFAHRMRRADAALDAVAINFADVHVHCDELGVAHVNFTAIAALPEEIGLRVLGQMFAMVGGAQPRLEQLENALGALKNHGFTGRSLAGCMLAIAGDEVLVHREAGRMLLEATRVEPGQNLMWDARFHVTNSSGVPVTVRMPEKVSRTQAEQFLGHKILLPMAAVRAAPVLFDLEGIWLALGTHSMSKNLDIKCLGARAHHHGLGTAVEIS